jgi:hypothetical protein
LTGLSFHRLPSLVELPRVTLLHVELLFFLASRLRHPCAHVHNLAPESADTGGPRGRTSAICEECQEDVFCNGECYLGHRALFLNGIVFGSENIYSLLFRR